MTRRKLLKLIGFGVLTSIVAGKAVAEDVEELPVRKEVATTEYIGNGGIQEICIGFQPSEVIVKRRDNQKEWIVYDTLRG